MKLKKLLASFTAAALAVTTMAVTSFTASAAVVDKDLGTGSLTSVTLEGNEWSGESYANPSIELHSDWTNPIPIEGYSALEIEYTCDNPENISNVYAVVQGPDDLWQQQHQAAEASGKITVDLSSIQDKKYTVVLVQIQPNNTYKLGDTFEANLSVTSAKLIASTDPGEGGDVTIPEGTKYTLASTAWNWQANPSLNVTGITNWTTTAAEAIEALDKVEVSFTVNGAISGGKTFDASKVSFVGVLQTNDSPDGLWKTYDAVVDGSNVKFTMDGIDEALAGMTGTVNFAMQISVATADATDAIDVYLSDITVTVDGGSGGGDEPDDPPPAGNDVVKGTLTLEGNNDWWSKKDISYNEFKDIDRSTGVIKFVGSTDFIVAYNSGGAWKQLDAAKSFTINLSDVDNENGITVAYSSNSGSVTVNWAASVGGTVDPDPISGGSNTPGGNTPGGNTPGGSTGGSSVTMAESSAPGWFEATISKDQLLGGNTGATTITFTGADLKKVGYNSISAGGYKGIDCEGSITIQVSDIDLSDGYFLHVGGSAATAVSWSIDGGSSSGGNTPGGSTPGGNTPGGNTPGGNTPGGNTPGGTTPGSTGNPGVATPVYVAPASSSNLSTSLAETITAAPTSEISFNLGSAAKLDKSVLEALAAKGDITVRFNVSGGAYWEINGNNVSAAKAVDLGVRMNGKLIPEAKVSEFAGDKTTIQLALKHNGDFGFAGVLNVPVGKANNGKFANLYYYHGGQFDFVGSSAITDGRAKFAFSHASNYLIVIDDYAYGEDVSSAAGMTETTETSAVPYVAALVVLAAFGASAVVLKKRFSK